LNFIRISSLRLIYLHPSVDPSLTHFFDEFPGSCTRCCGPKGGAGLHMKQTSRFKCRPWPLFEPRILQSDGRER